MSNTYNLNLLTETSLEEALKQATGPIEFNMTNDYMFRAVLQSNKKVLRGLVCSLLHLKKEEVRNVEITNPIQLGKTIDSKDFILDIHILLNNNSLVNLEMQVQNFHNWPERSLSYLCRSFDNLNKGDNYIKVKPAVHIGILDFDPFPQYPEFYGSYRMLNEINHHLYSDKFTLRVLSLKHIELATDNDKLWEIDHWAHLFKVKTWEELKMLADKEPDFIELSKEMFKQHADETIRDQCRAREDAEARERATKRWIEELTLENEALTSEMEHYKKLLKEHNISINNNAKSGEMQGE